jgi:hypothetical protein
MFLTVNRRPTIVLQLLPQALRVHSEIELRMNRLCPFCLAPPVNSRMAGPLWPPGFGGRYQRTSAATLTNSRWSRNPTNKYLGARSKSLGEIVIGEFRIKSVIEAQLLIAQLAKQLTTSGGND